MRTSKMIIECSCESILYVFSIDLIDRYIRNSHSTLTLTPADPLVAQAKLKPSEALPYAQRHTEKTANAPS